MAASTRNISSIDLKHLRCFVAIVDAGSVSRAALHLKIAQPALSTRMAALEQYLGTVLLHRTPAGARPTAAGQVFYASATRILRELASVAEEIAVLAEVPTGAVRFGCSFSTSIVLGKPLVEAVMERLPRVHFSFVSGASSDVYVRLVRGDLDYALIYKHGNVPGVTGMPLVREQMFLVVSADDSRFEGIDEIPASCAAEFDLVLPTQARNFGTEALHECFRAAGVALRVVAQIDAVDALFEMIESRKAVSIIPWAVCAQREQARRVRVIRIAGIDASRVLEFCVPSDHPLTPAAQAAADLTRQVVSGLIGTGVWRHAECL